MAKEVKIIWIAPSSDNKTYSKTALWQEQKRGNFEDAEIHIAKLLNEGWVIIAGGGGGSNLVGFIVFQREQ